METSTLIWIGGAIVAVGAFYWIKNGRKDPPPPPPPFKLNPINAKKAFVTHLNDFSKLLPTLLENFNVNEWTGAIVSVNDESLTKLWEKYVTLGETATKWMQLLASWQVKSDTC